MSDFNKFGQKSGDSINLSEIGDKVFTIIGVEDSPYTAKDGETFKVKCPREKVKAKNGGMAYYDLVAA